MELETPFSDFLLAVEAILDRELATDAEACAFEGAFDDGMSPTAAVAWVLA
jgi:hypothetical protein